MNVNFLSSSIFSKVQNTNMKQFSTNPISFGTGSDRVELSEEAQRQIEIKKLEGQIADLEQQRSDVLKKWRSGEITNAFMNSQYRLLTKQKSGLVKKRDFLVKIQEFLDSEISKTRPNIAFLYDPRLSPDEKEEELAKHPEIKTIRQIAEEADNERINYLNRIDQIFVLDKPDNKSTYIDISIPENKGNYEILLNDSKGKITLGELACKTKLEREKLEAMFKRGTFEGLKIIRQDTGKPRILPLISDDILEKKDNLNKFITRRSKYYKSLLRKDLKEPIFVPVNYLAKLGFGTVDELCNMWKEGKLKGEKKPATRKDGSKVNVLAIDIAPNFVENNLKKMRDMNKNYFTLKQLTSILHVRLCEVEKAVINGELELVNEYIFSGTDNDILRVNLDDPRNQKYAERLAFIKQVEQELVEAKEKRKQEQPTYFGLAVKIAWELAPKTKKAASSLAEGRANLARIIDKNNKRIEWEKLTPKEQQNMEEPEPLTKEEEIQLATYRKSVWEQSGTEEYSIAMKKAHEIVELYRKSGIDAIDTPEIKEIIINYMNLKNASS